MILLITCEKEKSKDIKISDQRASGQADKLIITDLSFNWQEITRCNCLFAKTDDKYLAKELLLARDSVGGYGLIQIGKNRLTIPISIPRTQKSKGKEWMEMYSNDTVMIVLRGKPIDRRILRTYSYNIDFEMICNDDTIKQQLIGHCSY